MESRKVPIRNELVVQLIRLKGIRENINYSAGEEDVLFRPRVNTVTMRTGKASAFLWGPIPQSFVNRFTDGRELGGGGTTNEQATNRALCFSGGGWFEIEAH